MLYLPGTHIADLNPSEDCTIECSKDYIPVTATSSAEEESLYACRYKEKYVSLIRSQI